MAYPADLGRTVVLKARRDTVVLVMAATGMTFALSSAIHSRTAPANKAPEAAMVDQQAWAGGLADVADATSGLREPVTSASLVVPTNELALPKVVVRPLVKLHGCDGAVCPTRVAAAAKRSSTTPAVATASTALPNLHAPLVKRAKPTLMSRLNPLNHLPDMAKIRRPFSVAGDTVSSWFRF